MSNLFQIKKILEKYNKFPKKSLGQNFLINPEIPKKTAEISRGGVCPSVQEENQSVKEENTGVIEIGPGIGALTSELCKIYKKVVAIEIDKTFEPILSEALNGFDNLKIFFDDIMEIDLQKLVEQEFSEFAIINVCANLPYYITTPVILKLVKSRINFDNITVMIQKEAADKLCSAAGEENYNATATIIGYYGEAKKIFNVSKSNFYPPPKVLSTVVNITRHKTRIIKPKSEDLMYKVIEAAFEQRRKTLVNALSSGLKLDKEKIADIVKKVAGEKNVNIRGEELDIKAFSDISDLLYDGIKM